MKDNTFLNKVCQGYKKEAIDAFIINKLFCCFIFIYYYFAIYKYEIAGFIPFVILCFIYELIACFFMYDTYLKLCYDKKQNAIDKNMVMLTGIRREISNIGNRGYSRMGKFFNADSRVQRYRIYYKINGKQKYVRTVLEYEQMFKMYVFIQKCQENNDFDDLKVEIEYYKNSKVLKNITSVQKGKLKKDIDEVFDLIFRFKHN